MTAGGLRRGTTRLLGEFGFPFPVRLAFNRQDFRMVRELSDQLSQIRR
jgi:hypothetical protein